MIIISLKKLFLVLAVLILFVFTTFIFFGSSIKTNEVYSKKTADSNAKNSNASDSTDGKKLSDDPRFVDQVTVSIEDMEEYAKNPGLNSLNDKIKISKNGESWGKILDLEKDIPEDGFMAYYFDTKNTTQIVREKVDSIALNFSRNEKYGIFSQNFGAYYVGYKNFEKETTLQLKGKISWAVIRVIINDEPLLLSVNNKGEIEFHFKKGKNKIEVEYLNNWHTTSLYLDFISQEKISDAKDLNSELSGINPNYDLWYGSLYESSGNNLKVDVNLVSAKKDTIVVLSSYSPIKWNLKNVNKNIKYIIHNGASLTVSENTAAKIIKVNNLYYTSQIRPEYHIVSGQDVYFETYGIYGANKFTLENWKKGITGFSVEYSNSILNLPNQKYDDSIKKDMENVFDEIEQNKKANNYE